MKILFMKNKHISQAMTLSCIEPTPPIQVKTTTKRNCGVAGGYSYSSEEPDNVANSSEKKDDCNDGFAGPNPDEHYSKAWGTIDQDGEELRIRNSFNKVLHPKLRRMFIRK